MKPGARGMREDQRVLTRSRTVLVPRTAVTPTAHTFGVERPVACPPRQALTARRGNPMRGNRVHGLS